MNDKLWYSAAGIILLVVLGGAVYYAWPALVGREDGDYPGPTVNIQGRVESVAASARVVTLSTDEGEVSMALSPGTEISGVNGSRTELSAIRRGFMVQAEGSFTSESAFLPARIRILAEPNIVVFSPRSGDEIGLPVVITGEARVFENTFSYRIKDSDGTVLMEGFDTADAPDIGQYGPFEVRASYPEPKGSTGTVEVLEYSAKDGSEINKVSVPVKFGPVDALTVKVHFQNQKRDPEMMDCSKTYTADRRIPRTQSVARAALEELLKGPTSTEYREGFITSINSGVKIQSLTIANGTARADFDETLERATGGSCRVAAIRSQITETLKQFSTVRNVVISIDGRTEDILQP